MAFVNVGGITLHYRVDEYPDAPVDEQRPSTRKADLVLLNSLGTDYRIWDGVVRHLLYDANSIPFRPFRIVRYDKRGHGLSDAPSGPYGIAEHAADLADLLDHLQIEQAILAGISVGGMIAMQFAATWPDRVHALVLCDTSPKIGTAAMWNERIDALRSQGLPAMAETILARWFAPSFRQARPEAYQGFLNMLTRMPLAGYVGTCEAIRDADLWPVARRLTIPTLVLCGAEDLATPPVQATEMAQAIPGARCEIIANAAHLPCVEQPVRLVQALATFFQEQEYG